MHYVIPIYMPTIYPVNQVLGIQSALIDSLLNKHPVFYTHQLTITTKISSVRDARNFITRINKFPVFFDQVMEELDNRAKPPFG